MGLSSYWRDRKNRKDREQMLKNTPHEERIWLFTKLEFVKYCNNNNSYVFCITKAVDLLLKKQSKEISQDRIQFNTKISKSFINMISHPSNQVRIPFRSGNDIRFMKPHPLECDRINTRVYEGLQAIKEILIENYPDEFMESIASRYIIDPYQVKENSDAVTKNN